MLMYNRIKLNRFIKGILIYELVKIIYRIFYYFIFKPVPHYIFCKKYKMSLKISIGNKLYTYILTYSRVFLMTCNIFKIEYIYYR
jgi:hypothetical protein